MGVYWLIRSDDEEQGLIEAEWLQLIEQLAELQRKPAKTVANPFKPGEVMEVNPPPTSVDVVVANTRVGDIECIHDDWGDDPPMALEATPVEGGEARMLEVLGRIAEELDGEIEELNPPLG